MVKKSNIRERYLPETVMSNWRELMEAIPNMNEDEVAAALSLEVKRPKGDRRGDFIIRLHRKLTKLRAERELAEYMP